MSETLEIFGAEYSGVNGIKATDDNGTVHTYIKPSGTLSVTENGMVDVTNYASVNVNVAPTIESSYELLASKEFSVSQSENGTITVGTINCGASAYTSYKPIYVRVIDKAGKRNGYFFMSQAHIYQFITSENTGGALSNIFNLMYKYQNNAFFTASGFNGIYVSDVSSSGVVTIKSKKNGSMSGDIDGTYLVNVYLLDYPDGVSPFA